MHMLQQLPEASCGVRNILEEEWDFVREITPYIRGGEVQAGKRFWCVTGIVLDIKLSSCDSQLLFSSVQYLCLTFP